MIKGSIVQEDIIPDIYPFNNKASKVCWAKNDRTENRQVHCYIQRLENYRSLIHQVRKK